MIPYEKFTLANGLTVVVHTDRKAPIVAVNVWYHVGSKNEAPGKTGFAHLFEHLMFQGSEHFDDEYFKPFEQVGATSMNGTTSFDRTNYFQNVPTTALDLALWMESDRMGHLLGVVDAAAARRAARRRQNEKRQGENRPYGRVAETVFRASFPPGHPYRTLPIGSMEDLDAATLDDVREWFRTYYGAANAVLVLAGDIDVRHGARQGRAVLRPHRARARRSRGPGTWIAARTRQPSRDDVRPGRAAALAALLEHAARQHARLRTTSASSARSSAAARRRACTSGSSTASGWPTAPSAGQSPLEIAGLFTLSADVKQGVPVARVEAAMIEELQRFIEHGPTQAELERREDRAARGLHPRPRAHRRLRRQGGRARLVRGLRGRSRRATGSRCSGSTPRTPADLQRVARQWLVAG